MALTGECQLDGVRVTDLTQVVSGSVSTMLMADFGADVIKVEPLLGEPYRRYGAEVKGENGTENLNALRFNRNKRSLALDLKTSDGREILEGLIANSDVVVENFRPGVLKRFGFDFARMKELNADLVYTSVSGYGHDDLLPGPYSREPAYAILAEAYAGLLHLAGSPDSRPVWMGFAMSDIFSGVLAFAGTLLALNQVGKGEGAQRVDIAMYDAALFMNDLAIHAHELLGSVTSRGQYPLQAPWGPFPARDGYIAIAIMSEHEWKGLCDVIGRRDLVERPGLSSGEGRAEQMHVIDAAITAWASRRPVEEGLALLRAAGVPCAPVRDAHDVVNSPQTVARDMLIDAVHSRVGKIRVVGNPIKSTVPTRLGETSWIPALGEHSAEVLRDVLGLSDSQVEVLRAAGVVGHADAAPTAQARPDGTA